ncbi:MAG: ArnT family glycosyltransferase [Acidocella sp.]|uniref:ArnT family glycosyltransferase n=1 Tax=Acidocella sp. TaxID=50710 RepID=UPI003FD7A6AF
MFDQAGLPSVIAQSGQRVWKVAAAVLAVLVSVIGWPLVLRSTAMVQFDYDEGWNALRQQQAAHFLPLYAAPPGLDITNYPPLSFHIIGLLSLLTGDANETGRFLSLAALVAVCVLAGALARLFVPARYAGTCTGLLFALWLEMWMPRRIGVNDPQLLGMVFELGGIYAFVRAVQEGRDVWRTAPLFALAVFIKHNLIALPLGAGLALLAGRDWRRLIPWVGAGALAAGVLLLGTIRLDGPYFLAHMLQPRAYDLSDTLHNIGTYLIIFLPFVLLAGAWAWRNRRDERRRPLAWSWAAAHVLAFIWAGGDGVSRNLFFEAVLLDAVIAVIAGGEYFATPGRVTPRRVALLCVLPMLFPLSQLLFPLSKLPDSIVSGAIEWRELPQHEADFAAGVALLRQASGPVVCENLLMCDEAGKPSAFDPYHVQDQINLGKLDPQDFVAMVESQRFGAVEIGDIDLGNPKRTTRFSKAFLQALAQHYSPALRTPEIVIWVPAPPKASQPG